MDELTREWSPEERARYEPNATYRPALRLRLRLWREGFEYLPRSVSTFFVSPPISLATARPASGPVHGGTRVFLLGDNLGRGWGYTCRFLPTGPTEPIYDADGTSEVFQIRVSPARFVPPADGAMRGAAPVPEGGAVSCVAPKSPRVLRSAQHADYDAYGALYTDLGVSNNAADFESNASTPFEFYHPPGGLVLSPMIGPEVGGTSVHVSGGNLTGGTDRRCRFVPVIFGMSTAAARRHAWELRTEVAASVLPGARLNCVTPRLPSHVAQVTVEVALNGQQYTEEAARFNVTAHREWKQPPTPPLAVPPEGAWGFTAELGTMLSFVPVDPSRWEPTWAVRGDDDPAPYERENRDSPLHGIWRHPSIRTENEPDRRSVGSSLREDREDSQVYGARVTTSRYLDCCDASFTVGARSCAC